MQRPNWKTITEAVGLAAIVGSLVFVGLQLRQDRQLTSAQLAVSLAGPTQELSANITQNISVWRRGNAGEPLDADERVLYEELIRARWSLAFWEAYSYQRLGSTYDIAAHVFALFLHDNPGARSTWLSQRNDRETGFAALGLTFPSTLEQVVRDDLDALEAQAAR